MNKLADLFLSFAKIGFFTFGGGYAMLPMIENHCVEKKHWITHDEMMDVTVIAESTPGPISINCSTFVGYKIAGFIGAAIATLGMVLPSFSIIFLISMFLDRFLEITLVAHAFKGIKIAVGILILDVGITMAKRLQKKALPFIILVGSFLAILLMNLFSKTFSSVALMLIAAILSLTIFMIKGARDRKGGGKK